MLTKKVLIVYERLKKSPNFKIISKSHYFFCIILYSLYMEMKVNEEELMITSRINFADAITGTETIKSAIWKACENLGRSLYKRKQATKAIQLKFLTDRLIWIERTCVLQNEIFLDVDLYSYCKELLEKIRDNEKLRIIQLAVIAGRLESNKQLPLGLFQETKKEKLNEAIQNIKDKLGESIITRACGMVKTGV